MSAGYIFNGLLKDIYGNAEAESYMLEMIVATVRDKANDQSMPTAHALFTASDEDALKARSEALDKFGIADNDR